MHNLEKKLANEKYRDAFVASRIARTLAFQLRVLRQRAGLSQIELAKKLGTSQNAISRMENPAYGKASISTLRKIASFFKVGLIVRFAPISEIVDWTTHLSAEAVDVPDFERDTRLADSVPAKRIRAATPLRLRRKSPRATRRVMSPRKSGRRT
jgi:transcriptional regulator with XRE-family HTH domain